MRDTRSANAEVEELLVACLDRLEREGPRAVDDVCREQPERAGALRSALAAIERLGLAQAATAAGEARVPERLGPFRLRSRLGGGAMGVVYLAEQEPFGRTVALKLVRPELVFFERGRERFRREAEALARLAHPGIVPVWAWGEDDGVPWIAMEPVDGASLADVLAARQGRDPASLRAADLAPPGAVALDRASGEPVPAASRWDEACARAVACVALALQHAHERGVLHRDIKPGNVLLARDGRVLLGDFGLARADDASRLTASGSEIGSLPYLAPELLSGASAATPASDVYALGVTLYELLTLQLPFSDPTPEALRHAILQGCAQEPRRLNPRVTWELQTVCAKAMEVEPGRRYARAVDLAEDLQRLLRRQPIAARPAGALLRARRWAQRNPPVAVALAAGALVTALSVTFAVEQGAARRRTESALDDVTRLADVKRLADLRAEAEGLWPAEPERMPAMLGWLQRADALWERRAQHQQVLARGAAGAAADDAAAAAGQDDFAAWRMATLKGLLEDLDTLPALMADVRARQAFAGDIDRLTLHEPAAAWERTAADIAAHPGYGALRITPQRGLIPLGADPDSGLFEFAHLASGAPPERGPDGRLTITADSGLVLVLLPGGAFRRVRGRTQAGLPRERLVDLSPYFLAKHELTQGQWRRATGTNPSTYVAGAVWFGQPAVTELHPVEQVSWHEALTVLRHMALTLPSEMQWEYAARAGTDWPWWTGDAAESLAGAANLADRSCQAWAGPRGWPSADWVDDGWVTHAPVGSYRANPFGLHDMLGNLFEWVLDPCGPGQHGWRPGDGLRDDGDPRLRLLKGGCFSEAAINCTADNVYGAPPEQRANHAGLRAARALQP